MKKPFSFIKERYYFEKDDEKIFMIPDYNIEKLSTLEKELY
jgi:hypothetical protein